ncbi:MAG: hypothetical protein WC725_01975 [Patescibacteria group bacterium]|jgi:hypothetical protein
MLNLKSKKNVFFLAFILLFVAIIFLLSAGGFIDLKIKNLNRMNQPTAGVIISYPPNFGLVYKAQGAVAHLSHNISYNGPGICDPSEAAVINKKNEEDSMFDELDYTIIISTSSVKDLIPNFEKKITPDKYGDTDIDIIKIGNIAGYSVLRAVEMCGSIDNYFPRSYGTLIISQDAQMVALRNRGYFKDISGSLNDEEINKIIQMIVETARPVYKK